MITFRIVLIAMTVITIVLIAIAFVMERNFLKTGKFALQNPFRHKPKSESEPQQQLSFFDKLLAVVGSEDIEVYNGVTYSQTRNDTDADGQSFKFDTEKWFKIKVGKYISGYGYWCSGFDYALCAVAEVYIATDGRVLHVCAGRPYYNSPIKEADEKLHEKVKKEIDEIKLRLSSMKCVMLRTNDPWLRGVLDTIHTADSIGKADLWKHIISIKKRRT